MFRASGTPDGQGDRWRPSSPPSLEELYEWFGTQFAILKAPNIPPSLAALSSDTSASHTGEHQREVRSVRVSHPLSESVAVAVTTTHDDGGDSVQHHTWTSLINYQLAAMGKRGGPPWGSGPPPAEYEHWIDANKPPEAAGTCVLVVDGTRYEWDQILWPDALDGQIVSACGGRIGDALVAVCAPQSALPDLELNMWPAES